MTEPDVDAFPLDSNLLFLREIWALNHSLERASKRMEVLHGLTARQRIIVRIIGKFPGITAGQLAQLLKVDPGTLSAAIARLEVKGWVERGRDARDQRRITISLTERGKQLDVPTDNTIENSIKEALIATSPEEERHILHFLARLIASLDGVAERSL